MHTSNLEAAIDKGKNRLDAISSAEADACDDIRSALNTLARKVGADDGDRLYAIDVALEAVTEMTAQVRAETEREISAAEDALGDLEYADLQRSRPIVL